MRREQIMSETTPIVTADELERMPEDDHRYELVRGRLVRMSPAAPRHGDVTARLIMWLLQHVMDRRLGAVWTEVGFRLAIDPDTVRAPDVAFVRADRLPAKDARGFYRGAPDLAVEVLSPADHPREVQAKVGDYLSAGAAMVLVLDAESREATVHRRSIARVTYGFDETLSLDPPVSGFTLRLADLFGDSD
jgi:Uma2 family endonuclease